MSVNKSRDLLPLLVMLESVEKILLYAKGCETAERFLWAEEQVKFNASLLLLSNIGEYANKLSEETRVAYPKFPWKQVRSLRNRIAHDYAGIDYEMIFDIVSQHIPFLKTSIEIILQEGLANDFFDKNECLAAKNSVFYGHIHFEQFDL